MPLTKPVFVNTVTHIDAAWANAVSDLLFDVFGLASNKSAARAALGLGTLALQSANNINLTGGAINNIPIGLAVPMQGRFTVLQAESDPVAPTHVVNKRYLEHRLADSNGSYVPLDGGHMVGPLVLAADPIQPLEAASRRFVEQRITDVVLDQAIQRKRFVATAGQTEFVWSAFVRPNQFKADNFLVFDNGLFLQYPQDFSITPSNPPKVTLVTGAQINHRIDVLYLNNATNLLSQVVAPPARPYGAAPAWADPVNLRIGYAVGNSGQNEITDSSVIHRSMHAAAIFTSGNLGDRQISWIGDWQPATIEASTHSPTLTTLSATEVRVSLPENVVHNEFYWEGRYELQMYVDGVIAGPKLWLDLNNQQVPNLTDGLVRWGVVGPSAPPPAPTPPPPPPAPGPSPEIAGVFGPQMELIANSSQTLANVNLSVLITQANMQPGSVLRLFRYPNQTFAGAVAYEDTQLDTNSNVRGGTVTLPGPLGADLYRFFALYIDALGEPQGASGVYEFTVTGQDSFILLESDGSPVLAESTGNILTE